MVGASPSAETEVIALTVMPWRPAGPSVVTTLTEAAARLMPSMKSCRNWLSGICALLSGFALDVAHAGVMQAMLAFCPPRRLHGVGK